MFSPDSLRATTGSLARGEIQPGGTYTLWTADKPGAFVGRHHVTIIALEPELVSDPTGRFLLPQSLLPDKYRDPDLSGLACEVKAGQENVLDFDLD